MQYEDIVVELSRTMRELTVKAVQRVRAQQKGEAFSPVVCK